MSELINPFPHPDTISKEINIDIVNLIKKMIDSKTLTFHDMLKVLERMIEKNDYERSMICAYYCVNTLLNDKYTNKYDKINTITELRTQIQEKFNKVF